MTTISPLPLAGRVAIVIGTSRGIGRAIASHLSSLGAFLVLGYTSDTDIDAIAASPRTIVARVDVSNPDDVRSLFDLAERAFHVRPHILVDSPQISDENCPRGAFLRLRNAANRLVRGSGGRIVMVSPSNATVEAMVRVVAKATKGVGITANCVAPDSVYEGKGDDYEDGRVGEAEDVAAVVGFLATDSAGWINGQVIRVNGTYV